MSLQKLKYRILISQIFIRGYYCMHFQFEYLSWQSSFVTLVLRYPFEVMLWNYGHATSKVDWTHMIIGEQVILVIDNITYLPSSYFVLEFISVSLHNMILNVKHWRTTQVSQPQHNCVYVHMFFSFFLKSQET